MSTAKTAPESAQNPTDQPGVYAYKQWVCTKLVNSLRSSTLTAGGASLSWGKFYKYPNKDDEISASAVDQVQVPSSGSTEIAACGRSDAASGTTGGFSVYEGDALAAKISWDCPWSGDNWYRVEISSDYWFNQTPQSIDTSGPIGYVTVEIGKKA